MASRLSELQVKGISDAGRMNLSWDPPKSLENLVHVDFKKIMASGEAEKIIANMPAQILYHSLQVNGPEESLEVLEFVTKEQLVRILDYDVWQKDELSPTKAFRWLRLFRASSGPEAFCERYQSLDEEYQVALLQKFVRIFDEEEIETLPESVREELFVLPCHKVFYQILSDDKEVVQFIQELVESALMVNIEYCYSLLAHAAYLPPNENEASLLQFRNARLEEDGFYTFNESMRVFDAVDLVELREKADAILSGLSASPQVDALALQDEGNFLDQVVAHHYAAGDWNDDHTLSLHQGFLYLANCLAASVRIESSDLKGLSMLLEQQKALVSLGLEYLAKGNLAHGRRLLDKLLPVQLFRTGLTLIREEMQKPFADALASAPGNEKFGRLFHQKKVGELIWLIETQWAERISLVNLEILKAAFNRFPMAQVKDGAERIRFAPIDSMQKLQITDDALDQVLREIMTLH